MGVGEGGKMEMSPQAMNGFGAEFLVQDRFVP